MDDIELLRRVAEGDERAFVTLYQRHAEAVLAFVTLRGADAGEAPEIAGAVWLACWQSAGTFRGDAALKTWLFAIAGRQVASHRRTAARRRNRELSVGEVPDSTDAGHPPEVAVVGQDTLDVAMDAVRGLPHQLYETAVLAWVEELPYADIAVLLDVPVGTVKSRISHARRRLLPELQDIR